MDGESQRKQSYRSVLSNLNSLRTSLIASPLASNQLHSVVRSRLYPRAALYGISIGCKNGSRKQAVPRRSNRCKTYDLMPCSLKNSSSSNIFSKMLTKRSLLAKASSLRSSFPPTKIKENNKYRAKSAENIARLSYLPYSLQTRRAGCQGTIPCAS